MGTRGAIFSLMTQDSKADKLINATEFLNQRMARIVRKKRELQKQGLYPENEPTLPTLSEISESHVVPLMITYKPHIALAFEYQRIVPEGASPKFGSRVSFELPTSGTFISDIAAHVVCDSMGNETDVPGSPTFNWRTAPRYRWCNLPGLRMFEEVNFKIKNNPISSYKREDALLRYKYNVPTDKLPGYMKNIGQETSQEAKYYHAANQINEVRFIKDGPQTLKSYQPPLNMYIPLMHWFNLDKSQPFNSSIHSWGQRCMEFKIAQLTDLVEARDFNDNKINPFPFPNFKIRTFELYANYMYVNPEIEDVVMQKHDFQLIRVYLNNTTLVTSNQNENIPSPNFKWPTEMVYFGIRPLSNNKSDSNFDTWNSFSTCQFESVCSASIVPRPPPIPPGEPTKQLVSRPLNFIKCSAPFASLSFKIGDSPLYPEADASFFNSYLPSVFGKVDNIRAPDDPGSGVLFFGTKPGDYQSTGHIGFSKTRQFNLQYNGGENISEANPVEIITSSTAINFIYSENGAAILKYAT